MLFAFGDCARAGNLSRGAARGPAAAAAAAGGPGGAELTESTQ